MTGDGTPRGLTSAAARRLLAEHGPNALPEPPSVPLWLRFLGQFRSALIYVLLLALAVDLAACDACSTVHHQECLEEAGGCTVFGCDGGVAPRRGRRTRV